MFKNEVDTYIRTAGYLLNCGKSFYFFTGTGDNKVLRQVPVPIIPTKTCNGTGWWNNQITNAMICAGYQDGKKKCVWGAC